MSQEPSIFSLLSVEINPLHRPPSRVASETLAYAARRGAKLATAKDQLLTHNKPEFVKPNLPARAHLSSRLALFAAQTKQGSRGLHKFEHQPSSQPPGHSLGREVFQQDHIGLRIPKCDKFIAFQASPLCACLLAGTLAFLGTASRQTLGRTGHSRPGGQCHPGALTATASKCQRWRDFPGSLSILINRWRNSIGCSMGVSS
ncbi:hypothetical protein CCP4SC76_2660010 [Gammaproteobacteria bacterium]